LLQYRSIRTQKIECAEATEKWEGIPGEVKRGGEIHHYKQQEKVLSTSSEIRFTSTLVLYQKQNKRDMGGRGDAPSRVLPMIGLGEGQRSHR